MSFEDASGLVSHLIAHLGTDAWWSPHVWESNRRKAEAWAGACAAVVDIDYYDASGTHAAPPAERAYLPITVGRSLGATMVHLTPRGARLVWVLKHPATDRDTWRRASTAICDRLVGLLVDSGFHVDRGASTDLARMFWAPRSTVDGEVRIAEIEIVGEQVDLNDLLPDERHAGRDDLQAAVAAYRATHPLDIQRSGGTCPICGHNGCFGRLPTDPNRWFCFSDRHEADGGGVGVRGTRGWHGDVLDLHAHKAGVSRVDVLRSAGYMGQGSSTSVGSGTTSPGASQGSQVTAAGSKRASVGSVGGSPEGSPTFRPLLDLPPELLPVPKFDTGLLPLPFRAWVEDIANRIQCPPDFPAVAAMLAYSSIVGRRIGIRPKQKDDWQVVANLWGGPVGRPGVMKTPGLQEPMGFLRRIEAQAREQYESAAKVHKARLLVAKAREQSTTKAIQAAIKSGRDAMAIARDAIDEEATAPVRLRYFSNDVTVEKLGELLRDNPNGILIFRDELTGLLRSLDKEGHEGARAFYLEAWNGTGAFTFDRIGRGTVEIDAAICSILGGIQPGPLASYLKTAMRSGAGDDGLVQRFQLLVYPDVERAWKNVDQWPETCAKAAAWEAYLAASQLDPSSRGATTDKDGGIPFLRFSADAQEVFDAWRSDLEVVVRSGNEHPAIEAHLSKYRSLVPSLALVTHLAEGRMGAVSVEAVQRAIGWVKYLEPHARRIYGLGLGSHLECRAIAKHILNRDLEDGFDARRVYRSGWSGLEDPSAVESGLEQLMQIGWIAEEVQPTRGRSATIYRINPKLWESTPGSGDRTDKSQRGGVVEPHCERESPPGGADRTDRSVGKDSTGEEDRHD